MESRGTFIRLFRLCSAIQALIHQCKHLTHLGLAGLPKLSDAAAMALVERQGKTSIFASILTLDLSGAQGLSSSAYVSMFSAMPLLEELRLVDTWIEDSAFAGISCPTLCYLDVSRLGFRQTMDYLLESAALCPEHTLDPAAPGASTELVDARSGITSAAYVETLKLLTANLSPKWTQVGLMWLLSGARGLHTLKLRNCVHIQDEGLFAILDATHFSVQRLDIRECTGITNKLFQLLQAAQQRIGSDARQRPISFTQLLLDKIPHLTSVAFDIVPEIAPCLEELSVIGCTGE